MKKRNKKSDENMIVKIVLATAVLELIRTIVILIKVP